MPEPERPKWVKDKTTSKEYEVVQTKPYDDYKDFKMEPAGHYIVVKLLWDRNQISVLVCSKDHEVVKEFRGRRAQDLYHAMFSYEEEHNLQWFTLKDHIAYIGKELKKAEIALALGNSSYFQE